MKSTKNRGWIVVFSGTGINLALGILYTWSIFKGEILESIQAGAPGSFNWDLAKLNDPYSVCCLVFAFAMILAGRCQDKFGPRITAFTGGILVGSGFIWIAQTTSYASWVFGFGILAGIGIGFGYSAATPPALKWFPAKKTGLIAGIVVSGFGLASVYIAPLSEYLLNVWGLQNAMLFFGLSFMIVVCSLATQLVNPPDGFSSKTLAMYESTATEIEGTVQKTINAIATEQDITPGEIIKTRSFYLLWLIYFVGAGAGLMVISSVAGMAKRSLGDAAFLAVAILAIGNAAGRIIAGVLSDKIGRRVALFIMLIFQAVLMFVAIPVVGSEHSNGTVLVFLATLIGFNYGTNLSLFPSLTKDLYGLKHFGTNYGLVFTAWGIGGFVLSRLSQMLQAASGSYASSFVTAGCLLIIGGLLTFAIRKTVPSTSV